MTSHQTFNSFGVIFFAIALALATNRHALAEDLGTYVYFLGTSFYFVNGGVEKQFEGLYKQAVANADDVHTDLMAISALPLELHVAGLKSAVGSPFYPDLENNDERENPYDWIIVQENSRVGGLGGEYWDRSIQAAQDVHEMAVEGGINTMYVMPWGYRTGLRPRKQPEVGTLSYLEHHQWMEDLYFAYIEATNTQEHPTYLAPVGLVYKTIYEDCESAYNDPLVEECLFSRLYKGDDFHNSMQGTYLMALTIVSAMTGVDPRSLTWQTDEKWDLNKYPFRIPEEEAEWIRSAVSRTILETFDSGMVQYRFAERPQWSEFESSAGFVAPSLQPLTGQRWSQWKSYLNPLWWLGCIDYGNGCIDPNV